jgi:hypothetical protein
LQITREKRYVQRKNRISMICVLSKIYIETYPIEVALNVGLGERIKP